VPDGMFDNVGRKNFALKFDTDVWPVKQLMFEGLLCSREDQLGWALFARRID
jgi:hypothetical protein